MMSELKQDYSKSNLTENFMSLQELTQKSQSDILELEVYVRLSSLCALAHLLILSFLFCVAI